MGTIFRLRLLLQKNVVQLIFIIGSHQKEVSDVTCAHDIASWTANTEIDRDRWENVDVKTEINMYCELSTLFFGQPFLVANIDPSLYISMTLFLYIWSIRCYTEIDLNIRPCYCKQGQHYYVGDMAKVPPPLHSNCSHIFVLLWNSHCIMQSSTILMNKIDLAEKFVHKHYMIEKHCITHKCLLSNRSSVFSQVFHCNKICNVFWFFASNVSCIYTDM